MPPPLVTVVATRPHTRALKDGIVRPETCDLVFEEAPVIIKAFRRMVRELAFDVCEMAMTTYICARAHGVPFTALPVFPMRAFHHGAILVDPGAGIRSPKALEGRRVGVNRGYTVTTGVWARGILQEEYAVDLDRITWVCSDDEHVLAYRPPLNVVPLDPDASLEALLGRGELSAIIGAHAPSPLMQPLIPDAEETGFTALGQRGLYPINHTIVVRDALLAEKPGLAADLFGTFADARRRYVTQLSAVPAEHDTPEDRFFRRVMAITGDPLPYGVEPNRAVLETLIRHCVDQHILGAPVAVETLFPAETLDLTA